MPRNIRVVEVDEFAGQNLGSDDSWPDHRSSSSESIASELDANTASIEPSLLVFPPYYFPADPSFQEWIVAVDGFACRPGSEKRLTTRWSIAMMGKLMRAKPHELQEPLFLGRVAPFIAVGLKKLEVSVRIGPRRFRLGKRTNGRGAFRGRIRLTASELCRALEINVSQGATAGEVLHARQLPLPVEVAVTPSVTPSKSYLAVKIPWSGWSVISDIDDTIKDSQVSPLRQLLANTFLREFRSVEGMADLYRDWANAGCQFHYVSSSPWQLLNPLQQLCNEQQFPSGTFHLRTFRLGTDLMRKMLLLRQRGKAIVIHSLLSTFPSRKFLLVGDSGERDPEIYCRAAQRFPNQIQGIYIRDVATKRMTRRRLEKLTEKLKPGLCRTFNDADELGEMSKRHLWE
jgi:hypothetical protein